MSIVRVRARMAGDSSQASPVARSATRSRQWRFVAPIGHDDIAIEESAIASRATCIGTGSMRNNRATLSPRAQAAAAANPRRNDATFSRARIAFRIARTVAFIVGALRRASRLLA